MTAVHFRDPEVRLSAAPEEESRQGYDEKKNEHVIYLEYRVRVKPGGINVPDPDALRLLAASTHYSLPTLGLVRSAHEFPGHAEDIVERIAVAVEIQH